MSVNKWIRLRLCPTRLHPSVKADAPTAPTANPGNTKLPYWSPPTNATSSTHTSTGADYAGAVTGSEHFCYPLSRKIKKQEPQLSKL